MATPFLSAVVQPRNKSLARVVMEFMRTRAIVPLEERFATASTGEKVLMLAYLMGNDFGGAAAALAEDYDFDMRRGLMQLDRDNGVEFARVMGWVAWP